MMPNVTIRLCNIALKPNISPATRLITARRICRNLANQLDKIRAERQALRRKARKLKAALPFTRKTIEDLERQAKEHRRKAYNMAQLALADYGQYLVADPDGLAEALGFDRLCDLLGINQVHRQQAFENGGCDINEQVFISRMEDSSTLYADEWGSGGPLYRACHAAMIRFIKECPIDQLPDPFAPGAALGPKLPPKLYIVSE